MTFNYKIPFLFKTLLIIFLGLFLSVNYAYSQDSIDSDNDFSNAENAEEKRVKWGTEEFKLELIKEMSSANVEIGRASCRERV